MPAVLARYACAAISTAALTLSACATRAPDATSANPATANRNCIPVQELSEWGPFDDLSVILSRPGSSHGYLLRLEDPLEGLTTAGDIDVVDTDLDGFICPDGPDAVYIVDCDCASATITSIYPVDRGRPAELL